MQESYIEIPSHLDWNGCHQNKKITNADEDGRGRDSYSLLVGM
jgi:hypothetical protein